MARRWGELVSHILSWESHDRRSFGPAVATSRLSVCVHDLIFLFPPDTCNLHFSHSIPHDVQLPNGTSSIPPLGLPIPDAVAAPNLPLHPHPAPNIAHLHTFRTFLVLPVVSHKKLQMSPSVFCVFKRCLNHTTNQSANGHGFAMDIVSGRISLALR